MQTMSADIFSNVAKKDYLSFFHEDRPRYQSVVEFLGFRKQDVSKAAGVPLTAVRYDEKIPAEVSRRIEEWANLLNLVAEHFDGSSQRTTFWFAAPNPLLGNVRPRDMIRFGRYKKLLKFVINALAENRQ